ncbi:NAD(P)-dependent oxidoreductase [Paenarthrobacter sp. YAF11_1]|uniref:NAD(P)-dependent oxidoreductase n=1 Tax=Paenarthrobacter sp. YAF11_1 TaxID=3233074 RepID=UPI003F9CBD21
MVNDATLFIGLGNMGRPMAGNIARSGQRLFVYDADPQATEAVAKELHVHGPADLEAVAQDVGTVILMLPTSRIVETVLRGEDGLFRKLKRGTLIIDMGSSEPESTIALAGEATESDLVYVDAPVSGGVPKAISGELAIMVGGEPAAAERAKGLLDLMGKTVVRVGPAGTGHAAKALNNLLSATNLAAAAEILSVAKSVGINPAIMIEVINGSTSRSQASEFKYPKHILNATYDSGFSMDLMLKDMRIARSLIESSSLRAPIVLSAETLARHARETLDSPAPDHTELARYYEITNKTSFSGE